MTTNRFDFTEIKIEVDNEKKLEIESIESELKKKKIELKRLERKEMVFEMEEKKEELEHCKKEISRCKKEMSDLEKSFKPYKHFEGSFEPIKLTSLKKTDDEKTSLPYSENLTIYSGDYERIEETLILARGDTRSIDKFLEIGGFHPQATAENAEPKSQAEILDPSKHAKTAQGSGLVSFTARMRIAKNFSRYGLQTPDPGTVYLAKVTGALHAREPTYVEDEYTAPGGIDKDDIVAYRKTTLWCDFEGSVYIRKDFIKEHPELINRLIEQLLEPGEKPQEAFNFNVFQGKMFDKMDKDNAPSKTEATTSDISPPKDKGQKLPRKKSS